MDALLTWNGTLWHGHTELYCMSMSQETFHSYIVAYQEALGRQAILTSHEVMAHVTRLSYWVYANYDRAIRLVSLPGCVLKEQGGERA